MSFKEVTRLRKSGLLQEALDLAILDLEQNPNDEWSKKAIVWVYVAYLKIAQENRNFHDLLIQIENIKNLNLPDTEKMAFDAVAWQVGKYLFAVDAVSPHNLAQVFDLIKNFMFSKKTDSFSFLLKAFKKHSEEWSQFIEFVNWWGLENFKQEDYFKFILDNGRKIPSTVESIYIAISKNLLKPPLNIADIESFIPKIAQICVNYPEMQYPPYYHAKLMIAIGNKDEFLKAFIPFVKKKKNDFWVWDLLSEAFYNGSEEYFSCLCKSALCRAPEKFIGNVREKIAKCFVVKQMYPEAKFEFLKIIETREKEGWVLRDKHFGWQNFKWWNNTQATKSNLDIYEKHVSVAQGLLFADTPEEILVIDTVNTQKLVFNFIVSKEKYGFTSYRKHKIAPEIGEVYAVRFINKTDDKSNFYKILSIIKTTKKPSSEIYKNVEGIIEIRNGNSFGFVDNVFVSPQLIGRLKLQNGEKVNGSALQTFNTRRKAWGWNLVNITNK